MLPLTRRHSWTNPIGSSTCPDTHPADVTATQNRFVISQLHGKLTRGNSSSSTISSLDQVQGLNSCFQERRGRDVPLQWPSTSWCADSAPPELPGLAAIGPLLSWCSQPVFPFLQVPEEGEGSSRGTMSSLTRTGSSTWGIQSRLPQGAGRRVR